MFCQGEIFCCKGRAKRASAERSEAEPRGGGYAADERHGGEEADLPRAGAAMSRMPPRSASARRSGSRVSLIYSDAAPAAE
jgi:hypothetical protein